MNLEFRLLRYFYNRNLSSYRPNDRSGNGDVAIHFSIDYSCDLQIQSLGKSIDSISEIMN